jgi:hypothetical protein
MPFQDRQNNRMMIFPDNQQLYQENKIFTRKLQAEIV